MYQKRFNILVVDVTVVPSVKPKFVVGAGVAVVVAAVVVAAVVVVAAAVVVAAVVADDVQLIAQRDESEQQPQHSPTEDHTAPMIYNIK